MCNRFAITIPVEAMARLFDATPGNDLPPVPNFNVCPTTQIHAVWSGEGARRLGAMRWGFLPRWYKEPRDGPLLTNARAETIAEKPAFRDAARTRRCLVPASGFYEWQKGEGGERLPWYFTRADGAAMAFAGIWQDWERGGEAIRSCAIVTTASSPDIAPIHGRMPVILEPKDWGLWLGEEGKGAALLMHAPPPGALGFCRVSKEVNATRAKGPQLIEPLVVD